MPNLTPAQDHGSKQFTEFMLNPAENHMIIGGWAGCGKTFLVEHLLQKVEAEEKMYQLLLGTNEGDLEIRLTATTNKAANVLADSTGRTAKTIYSLLGLKVQNDWRTGKSSLVKTRDYCPQKNTLIFIDEASFLDENSLQHILEATQSCKVVFIMDPYQLAPVHEDKPPVWEMPVRKVLLSDVVRQGVGNSNNPIANLSAQFREAVKTGVFPRIVPDGNMIQHADGPTFQRLVDQHFALGHMNPNHGKILAWTNERVQQYNAHVRSLKGFSGPLTVGETVVTNNPIFDNTTRQIKYPTDAVVRITNVEGAEDQLGISGQYVQLNGGHYWFMPYNHNDVVQLHKRLAREKDWAQLFACKENWVDLRPLHSCTCHKSQGSTYRKTFIDLGDIGRCSDASDVARMLYVATSRAAEQVIFYGSLPRRYGG